MKTSRIFAALLLLTSLTASAQEEVMTVYKTDGTSATFRVSDVERVEFGVEEQAKLSNQYEADGNLYAITAVAEVQPEGYTYRIYDDSDMAIQPALTIRIAPEMLGQTIDLKEAAAEDVCISYHGGALSQPAKSGSLTVKKDKFGKNITISLNAEWEGKRLRLDYSGTFGEAWEADNACTVVLSDGTRLTAGIPSVLRVRPTVTGGATHFAFGTVEAASAADLLGGDFGVCFSLSAKALGSGTIDVEESMASYAFQLVNYANSKTLENSVSTTGTITSYLVDDGGVEKVFFRIALTLGDGTTVNAEYFGTCTETNTVEDMFPLPELPNSYVVTTPDGQTDMLNVAITSMQVRRSGTDVYLYFLTNDATNPDEKGLEMPLVVVDESFVNAGIVNIPTDMGKWKVYLNDIQLQSADNEWVNAADNGTISVKQDGDYYEVYASMANTYSNFLGTGKGDGRVLTLSFKGEASPYTGTK